VYTPSRLQGHLRTLAKSTIVSIIVIVVEVVLIFVLDHLHVPDIVSYASVQILGTTITFVGNKYWVFDAGGVGSIFAQGAKAICVFVGSLVLNTVLPSIGSYGLGVAPVPSFLASQIIVYLAWNYPMNRWWVFPSRPSQPSRPSRPSRPSLPTASDPSSIGTSSRPSP
jgi:putative flippase GtrA